MIKRPKKSVAIMSFKRFQEMYKKLTKQTTLQTENTHTPHPTPPQTHIYSNLLPYGDFPVETLHTTMITLSECISK